MTRLHDVTVGKLDQFKRELAQASLDGELVDAVLRRPYLAENMIGWLREQVTKPLDKSLRSLDVQSSLLGIYNKKYWKNRLTDADFRGLRDGGDSTHVQRVDDLEILHDGLSTSVHLGS